MNRFLMGAIAILSLVVAQRSAFAAGFDCSAPSNRVEVLICVNGELSALDDRLTAAYAAAGGAASSALAGDERRWIVERNRCTDSACLIAAYRERIATLSAQAIGPIAAPTATVPTPASVPSVDAVHYWGLPTLQGLPALQFGDGAPPTGEATRSVFWPVGKLLPMDRTTWLMPPSIGWTRAMGALGLSLSPQSVGTFDDVTLRNLACNFLDRERRAVFYGRSPLYYNLGPGPDVCAASMIPATNSMADVPPGLLPLLQAGSARFRAEALPELIRNAPKLPLRVLVKWQVTLNGGYDRAKGGYPMFSPIFSRGGFRLFGSPVDIVTPTLWPLSLEEATAFETRYKPRLYATLHLVMPLTITGATPLTAGGERMETGLPEGQVWHFETGPVSMYEDADLTHLVHTFAPATPPLANVAGADPRAGGTDGARYWGLPLIAGLPVATAGDHQPSLVDFSDVNSQPSERLGWTRAMRSLGLSLAPEQAASLPDAALLDYARLFLPPSRLASVNVGERCDYTRYLPGCEFVVRDAAASFRAQDLPKIIQAAPRLPFRMMLSVPMRTESWNQARGGFPLVSQTGSPGQAIYPEVFGTALDTPLPLLWPADETAARTIVARQTPAPGGGNLVYLGLPVTITGMHAYPHQAGSGFARSTGLPTGADWRYEPGEAVLYSDPGLSQKLYSFGAPRRLPGVISAADAANPKPVSTLALSEDTALLLLIRSGKRDPATVDWSAAALSRLSWENRLRRELAWSSADPWGLFFDRAARDSLSPPDPREAEAFRDWSLKRAATLPEELLMRLALWPAQGAQHFVPFDTTARAPMMRSAWAFPGSRETLRDYAAALKALAIAPEQMMPVGYTIPGANLVALFAAPRPPAALAIDLPQGIPQNPPGPNSDNASAVLEVAVRIDGLEFLRTAGIRDRDSAMLVRTQPVRAVVSRIGGGSMLTVPEPGQAPLVSVGFAPAPWAPRPDLAAAPLPAPAPRAPPTGWQGPDPDKRLAGAPYGPDVLGIRLGTSMADAEKAISEHMNVVAVVESNALPEASGPAGMIRGKVFVSNDRADPQLSEQIVIFEAPAVAAGKVVAIQRSVYVAEGSWDALSAKLVEKYGVAEKQLSMPGQQLTWAAAGPLDCKLNDVSWMRWAATPEFPGRRIERIITGSMPWPAAGQADAAARCGPMVQAAIGGPESLADRVPLFRFTTKLYDPGVLAWINKQRQPLTAPVKL